MGTRSLTVFVDENGNEIVVMYRQLDGYPDGHGKDLAEFLKDFTMVNGFSMNETRKIANGMGCLSAQVIAHFKNKFGVGGIYLHPAGTRDCWEEYIYTVTGKTGEMPEVEVRESDRKAPLYKGSAEKVYFQIMGKEPPTFEENLREKLLDYRGFVPAIAIQMAWRYRYYRSDPVSGEVAAKFFRNLFPEDKDYYRVINGICKHHPLT